MAHANRILLPGINKPIIGMVHLQPLPGAPLYGGVLEKVVDAALYDARALAEGGVDVIMLENYGDVPFTKGPVQPHVIALLAAIGNNIRRETGRPLGINVLRNDPIAALGVAAACGAAIIRVNVHTGAMLTDQGIIEGNAHTTLAYRTMLGTDTRILADINVKHARPLAVFPIEEAAQDATERGLADGLIVTGSRTGATVQTDELIAVRNAVVSPVLAGSGVTAENATELLAHCDGAIVGSWLKMNGEVHAPVDPERVHMIMTAAARSR